MTTDSNPTTEARLLKVHGPGLCHICGLPKTQEAMSICSYPHAMLPKTPVDPEHPEGFWSWSETNDER